MCEFIFRKYFLSLKKKNRKCRSFFRIQKTEKQKYLFNIFLLTTNAHHLLCGTFNFCIKEFKTVNFNYGYVGVQFFICFLIFVFLLDKRTRTLYGTFLIPLLHTYLFKLVSIRTSLVRICFSANFLISRMARGAFFLNPTPCRRLCKLMVYTLVTTSAVLLSFVFGMFYIDTYWLFEIWLV